MDYYPHGPAPGVAHGAHGHHAHGYGRPVNNVPHLGHGGHPQGHPGHPHHGQHGHGPPPGQPGTQIDEQVLGYVEDLQLGDEHSDVVRENALLELSKRREFVHDLAPLLWHSCGTISVLIQEIVEIYPYLTSNANAADLTPNASNRVCNSLALLQCVASHPDTRPLFLRARLPLLLFPFLNTSSTDRPFEYLRLTSLGVIGALVKVDDQSVTNFLLNTEIVPLCLRIMENGSELSKTVATFIVQKLLLDEAGLCFVCQTPERFYAVAKVLAKMVDVLVEFPSIRLLRHVVRCYLRLCDNRLAKEVLRRSLPDALASDPSLQRLPESIRQSLEEDQATKRWLQNLLQILNYK